jgi:hypothetical protein
MLSTPCARKDSANDTQVLLNQEYPDLFYIYVFEKMTEPRFQHAYRVYGTRLPKSDK